MDATPQRAEKRSRASAKAKATAEPRERPKLKRKEYEQELRGLQGELCALQEWIRATRERVIVVFEGRDAAGKGGAIKAITERVSPRVFRVVALPAPSDREKSQLYLQRYLAHFPAAGEIAIFDRSWYNRAGVEVVLGFCTPKQRDRFLDRVPVLERYITSGGVRLIKYWLEVSEEEQKRRFQARIDDPVRQWKLSPTDLESRRLWYDYSRARDLMLAATDTKDAPWHIVSTDDKRRGRLNCISHLLGQFPYKSIPRAKVSVPKRAKKGAYDDEAPMRKRRWIPEPF